MIRAISITRSSYETTWGDRLEAATESAAAYVEAVQRPLRQALSRPDTTVSIHDIMPDIASHLDGARALARFAVLNRQARELAANNDEYRRAGVVQKLLRYAEQEHPERKRAKVFYQMLTAIDGATPILSRAQKRRLWCYESARYSSLGHSDNAKPGAKMLAHIFEDLRPRVQNQVVAACGPKYYWGQYGISPNDSVSAIVRALRVIRPEQRTQVISWLDSIPDVHTRHVIVAKGLRHADCLPEAAVEKLLTHIEGEQNRWETERNLEALEKHAHRLPDRFAARVVGLILAAHAQSEDRKPGFCKNATVAQCHELTIEAQSASDRGDHFEAARILSALTQRPFRPDRLVMQNEQSEIAAAISALPESMRVVIENKGFQHSLLALEPPERPASLRRLLNLARHLRAHALGGAASALPHLDDESRRAYWHIYDNLTDNEKMRSDEMLCAHLSHVPSAAVREGIVERILLLPDSRFSTMLSEHAPAISLLSPAMQKRVVQRAASLSVWNRQSPLVRVIVEYSNLADAAQTAVWTRLDNGDFLDRVALLGALAPHVLSMSPQQRRLWIQYALKFHDSPEHFGRIINALLPALRTATPEQWNSLMRDLPQAKVDSWREWLTNRVISDVICNDYLRTALMFSVYMYGPKIYEAIRGLVATAE